MTKRTPASRLRALAAVGFAATIVLIAGCSGQDSAGDGAGSDSGGSSSDGERAAAPPQAARELADGPKRGRLRPELRRGHRQRRRPSRTGGPPGSGGPRGALIKTAVIELHSDDVGEAVAKIDRLRLRWAGGRIDTEETSTDEDGVETARRIELKVPVDDFDDAVDKIAGLADLVSKARSTEDVTARVADVESRVTSARDSIDQLRTLFSRATKLGEVITLERELSQREADLEALQAQLRALNAKTSLSTIAVSVTQPPPRRPRRRKKDDKQAGFVSGIKKGWDGLVTFVVGTGHAVGLLLPLGCARLAAARGWRCGRWSRRVSAASSSGASIELNAQLDHPGEHLRVGLGSTP